MVLYFGPRSALESIMHKTTFGEVKERQEFKYDGVWYVKVAPKNKLYNAYAKLDETERFWFDATDIVYI